MAINSMPKKQAKKQEAQSEHAAKSAAGRVGCQSLTASAIASAQTAVRMIYLNSKAGRAEG